MGTIRALSILSIAFITGAFIPSCDRADPGLGDGGVCDSVTGYVSACGEPSGCESAIVRDCSPLAAAVAPAYADAFAECMRSLGDPMGCMDAAVEQTPSSEALSEFATTLCLECGDGAGDCEDEVADGTASTDLARAGRLARALDGSVLDQVTQACATGDGCADAFYDCAVDIISRSLPDETSACLADAVVNGAPGEVDCAADDDDDNDDDDDDDDAADDGDDTGGVDDDGDDGDDSMDDGNDDAGDDSGACTSEGCTCMFTEDCDAGLSCTGGKCSVPAECEDDPNELNDSEETATYMPPIGDADELGSQISGNLRTGDIDWFRYAGADELGAFVNPYAQVNVFALELCIYAECEGGLANTTVTCPEGTTQSPSPGGRPGCCAANTMGFELDMSCTANPFGSDDATIYMRVAGGEAGVCQDFTLGYHY